MYSRICADRELSAGGSGGGGGSGGEAFLQVALLRGGVLGGDEALLPGGSLGGVPGTFLA